MDAEEWEECREPSVMIRDLDPRLHDRKLRLFACACCYRIWDLIADEHARELIQLCERWADGEATLPELRATQHQIIGWATAAQAARCTAALDCASWRASANEYLRASLHAVEAVVGTVSVPSVEFRWKVDDCRRRETIHHVFMLRDIVGNPFRPTAFSPEWRTSTAVAIARGMYESRDFSPMPILADALQDAGCDSDDILNHCRDPLGVHVRGCWVVDLVLGKA